MNRRFFIIISFIIFITACATGKSNSGYSSAGAEIFATARSSSIQNVQLKQGAVLPAYGMSVTAEAASLTIRITTSKNDTAGRLEDIQDAIDHISALASENESINLEYTFVNQVGGSYERETPTPNVQNLDSSSVTIKLSTDLAGDNDSFIESLSLFNDFLNQINLSETITVEALSIEAELGDTEAYRRQIISQVYQELDSIQGEYGKVEFEISGLHSNLQIMRLSDTEYYVFIEPTITVNEFSTN